MALPSFLASASQKIADAKSQATQAVTTANNTHTASVDERATQMLGGMTPVQLAAARGIPLAQSNDLLFRMARASVAKDEVMAKSPPGTSGQVGYDAAMKVFGPIEPWMAQALANERNAMGGAPVPTIDPVTGAYNGGGVTYDLNGQTLTARFPQYWNPDGKGQTFGPAAIFKEATQDPAHKDSGQYIPNPNLLPRGATQHSDGLEGIGNIVSGNAFNREIAPVAGMAIGTMIGGPGLGTALGGAVGKLVQSGYDKAGASGQGGGTNAAGTGAGLDGNGMGVVNRGTSAIDPTTGQPIGAGGAFNDGLDHGLSARLLEQANAPGRTAPQLAAQKQTEVALMDPAVIDAIERVNAGTMSAAQIDPVTRSKIAQIGIVNDADFERIAGAKLDPSQLANWERVQAGQMQAAQSDPAAMAQAAQIRRDEQAQMRARQLGVLQQLDDAAAGNAPSVAQLMLRRASDENISQQQGLAAAARGPMVGLAAMNAASKIGDLNQKAALDQAILRAQEMATARGQLGAATDAVRNQDIGLESTQAGFINATNLANQGAWNERNLANANLRQDAAKTNLGTSTQVNLANQATGAQTSQFNASQLNTRAAEQAKLIQQTQQANQAAALQVSLANAQARNQAAIKNAELAQQAYSQDASATNARALEQARLEQSASVENLRTLTQTSLANAAAENARSTSQAQLNQQASTTNVGATNQRNIADAQTARDIAIANQKATLEQQALDDQKAAALRNAAITSQGQVSQAATSKYGADSAAASAKYNTDMNYKIAQTDADAKLKGGLITAGGSALPLLYDAYNKSQDATKKKNDADAAKAATDFANGIATSQRSGAAGSAASSAAGPAYDDSSSWDFLSQTSPDIADDSYTSDRRAKTDIRDGSSDIAAFLDAMSDTGEQSYRYKDPADGTGKRYGKMAQDIEQSKVGKTIVKNNGGTKEIDTHAAVSAMLAAMAEVNGRLRKLERRSR